MKLKGKMVKFQVALLPVVTKITGRPDKIRGIGCKRVQELKHCLCFPAVFVAPEDLGTEGLSRSLGTCTPVCELLALVLF